MEDNRPSPPSRRDVLRISGLAGLGTLAGTILAAAPARAAGIDYTARKTFDDWDRLFQQGGPGQPDQPNDNTNADGRSGMLAWSQSYNLLGLVRMYETYQDTYYLDRVVENVDQVLTVRDSARGVTDYRGKSLPAWRADHPYTAGFTILADSNGHPVLEVRQALSYAENTSVNVLVGTQPDRFTLQLVNTFWNRSELYTDLSLDPASPDYAVKRIYDATPGPLYLTARALPGATGVPVPGTFPLKTKAAIFAVHTGMITYPIATFVRLVMSSPALLRRYKSKAMQYLVACAAAVAVHDWEYRENELGEGYVVWPKGQPLPYDGCEQPINQSLALGQTLIELALVTRRPEYRRKVTAMARMFSRQLAVDPGDAYRWHYWPTDGLIYNGYAKTGSPDTDVSVYTPAIGGAKQYEDISHGAIDVEFAVRAYRAGLGFTAADMARLARTYTRNVATTDSAGLPAIHTTVAGTGTGAASVAHQAPRWMQVTPWDPEVHRHCLALYDRYQPTPERDGQQAIGFGWLLANVAYLNWGARYAR